MPALKWTISHAVFVTEIDDDHREILVAVSDLQTSIGVASANEKTIKVAQSLVDRIEDHFAHEERLMRASRYGSFGWHKEKHDAARKRVGQFFVQLQEGDADAGPSLIQYLPFWLEGHMRTADMMLGAFLRNHRRVGKVIFRAGTKPAKAGPWFDSRGERFDPAANNRGY